MSREVTYRSLVGAVQSPDGFIEYSHCDSLLFTGLLGAAGVPIRNIHAAEIAPGKWLRRPPSAGECYPTNSGSSISRDMLLGLLWYCWAKADVLTLERLYRYGSRNGWKMGEGDPARTGMRTLRGTLVSMLGEMGSDLGHWWEKRIVDPQLIPGTGYRAHLQVLHILLRGAIFGRVNWWHRQILKWQADRNPDSPLMQAAAARWVEGKYAARYIAASNNATYFPIDRLPTSADRSTEWAVQQSNPADWAPAPEEGRTHSGGDWLFANWIYKAKG